MSLLRHYVLENICSVCTVTQSVLYCNIKKSVNAKSAPTERKEVNFMTKLIAILLCMMMLLSACGTEPQDSFSENTSESQTSSSQSFLSSSSSSSSKMPESSKEENKEPYSYKFYPVKTWTNSIGISYAQVVFEITNTSNYDLYLGSADVELETENGSLFAVQNYINAYPQIISPGENAYYFESIMLDSAPEGILYDVWNIKHAQSKVPKIQFPVTDVKISSDSFGYIKAIGRVENTSNVDQSLVYVSVMLFDENNVPIGHTFTFVDVAANDTKGFECMFLNTSNDININSVASYTVVAYPNQFNY